MNVLSSADKSAGSGIGESQLSRAYVCEECALMHACMHIYICVVEYIF